MFSAEKISIFGNKAVIKQNKFGVWQFRMWISSEKKYVEKSSVILVSSLQVFLNGLGVYL